MLHLFQFLWKLFLPDLLIQLSDELSSYFRIENNEMKSFRNRAVNKLITAHPSAFVFDHQLYLMNLERSYFISDGQWPSTASIPLDYMLAVVQSHVEKWLMMHSFPLQCIKIAKLNGNMLANFYSMACQQIHPSKWMKISEHVDVSTHFAWHLSIFSTCVLHLYPYLTQVLG